MLAPLDVAHVRQHFPSMTLKDSGKPRVYFDNPAGTQVPQKVIDRTVDTLLNKNANLGGFFSTTTAVSDMVGEAHHAMADFYGASSAREIVFGQNMTTLTLHMSRCLANRFAPGDEIILSRMEHDANVGPWLLMADDVGMKVRWLEFDTDSYEFPADALTKVLSEKTRLLAMGMASNCTGTINDTTFFAKQAKVAGALVYLDAVQYAPHECLDMTATGADFVVSSAYKWFGPHMAVLWGREDLLNETFAYKVRPASNKSPDKFETGTLSHEGMAGCLGAIEYLEMLGQGVDRRTRITSAWTHIAEYERALGLRLIDGIRPIKGLTVRGITSANAMHRRVPTISFTVDGIDPAKLAQHFASQNIFVWSGDNYAVEPVKAMGLSDKGGVLRVGLAHYNTEAEVDGFITSLKTALA
jgi:cysteine desulfurase family protein (TIGR01976 family)